MGLELVVVLNNISSPQRLTDVAKLVYGLSGLKAGLVVTRVSGMAAQSGVPEVSKYAFRRGRPFLVLPSLQDALDMLRPDRVLVLAKTEVSKDVGEVVSRLEGRVAVLVNGSDSPPTKAELALGEHVTVAGFDESLPPQAALAVVLYLIASKRAENI
ncbi:MAG: RecB-family nuclease [Zestosphaera sp.]